MNSKYLCAWMFLMIVVCGLNTPAHADCDHPGSFRTTQPLSELSQIPQSELPAWSKTQTLLKIYQPEIVTTLTQAIIVPPTGGENFLDRNLASQLCKAGIYAMTLNYDSAIPSLSTDLKIHDIATEEFLAQLEGVLRYSPSPTVLVGSSLGGLLSSIAYGISVQGGYANGYKLAFDPYAIVSDLVGVSLTCAGGALSGVLADSDVDGVVAQRELRMKSFALSRDQYVSVLSEAIHLDTVALAQPAFSGNVQFFEGLFDSGVPTQYQETLWNAWGQPNREQFILGHPETIFWVYEFKVQDIAEFVQSFDSR